METETNNKYCPDELKFMQEFKIPQTNRNFDDLKRIYSLKFKDKSKSSSFIELKERCENDENKDFMKEWLQDNELIEHLSFRTKSKNIFWKEDDDIVILYGEYLPNPTYKEIMKCDYDFKFKSFWNFEILDPIINSFIKYAVNYTSSENISGKIEFVNMGDKVGITYLG